MRHLVLPLFLCLALPAQGAFAAVVAGLYQAEVPVAGQGAQARAGALREALAQVVTRVTGRLPERWRPALGELPEDAEALVSRFGYRPAPEGEGAPALLLQAEFDPGAVRDLVEEAGLPVWGRVRPAVAAWVAVDPGGTRFLAGSGEGDGTAAEALAERAAQRGLPLVIPLHDLEDQAGVVLSDVWGGFGERVHPASARYDARASLVGRARRLGDGRWEGRWALVEEGGAVERWSARAASLPALAEQMVDRVADTMAARFAAGGTGGRGGFVLTVRGVDSVEAYAGVLRYLGGIDGVAALWPVRVEPGSLALRLEGDLGPEALARRLELGRVLARGADGQWEYAGPP